MTEAIIIVVFIMFFLWMIWRLIISRFCYLWGGGLHNIVQCRTVP